MRKTFIAVAVILVGLSFWGWLQSQRGVTYPSASVEAELVRLAPALGASCIEMRTVAGAVRGSRARSLESLARKISGKPPLDDLVEFTFRSGPDTIHVTIHHSHGWAGLIEIRSSNPSSPVAAALSSGLATSFPKLNLEGP